MIKTENGVFFMTAGEACYVFKVDGTRLKHVYFGKRLEPEDELSALGCGADGDAEFDECELRITCKNGKTAALAFVGAEVTEQKALPDVAPTLHGGKTLKITLCDKKCAVRAELYYTPYARGGFSRRVAVINDGGSPITVDANARIAVFSDAYLPLADKASDASTRKMSNFAAVVKSDASDRFGEAYGFLCAYGDGTLSSTKQNGVTEVTGGFGTVTVRAHETAYLTEVLIAYSDIGIGGMSRVFHDILRENMGTSDMASRRPTVLFCPSKISGTPSEAAKSASELGCDVLAIDIGTVKPDGFSEFANACKASGVKLGIRFKPNAVKTGSVLGGAVELADGGDIAAISARLAEIVENNDVEYVMIDTALEAIAPIARGLYGVRRALVQKFPELIIEWGAVDDRRRYEMLLCYPPCMMRNIVRDADKTSLKTEFDSATFGCLGYKLDPTDLDADKKRAIRAQILSYQDDAPTVIRGDLYITGATQSNGFLMAVSKDKSKAYAVCNMRDGKPGRAFLYGLDEHNIYRVRELNKAFSGAALVRCGVAVPKAEGSAQTYSLHIRQVADFE